MSAVWLCICYGLLLYGYADCTSCLSNSDCSSNLLQCNNNNLCEPVSCTQNDNCTLANTTCQNNICACSDGNTEWNGQCTKVLGRVCSVNTDCDIEFAYCSDNECVCYSQFQEIDDVCQSEVGKECVTYEDCGTEYDRLICSEGSCQCQEGFKLNLDNMYMWLFDESNYHSSYDFCNQIIHSTCNSDLDCPMNNTICKWSSCRCVEGTSYDWGNYKCHAVLGLNCVYADCQSISYTICDSSNICSCKKGFVKDEISQSCQQVLDSYCTTSADCGDTSVYNCSSGSCDCRDMYTRNPDFYNSYTSYNYLQPLPCTQVVGRPCNETDCDTVPNAACIDDTCICVDGFVDDNGYCRQVLGTSCTRNEPCELLAYATCGSTKQCECREGFMAADGICIQVLDTACTDVNNCSLSHTTCSNGVCACHPDYPRWDNRCLPPMCHDTLPELSEIYRRLHQFSSQNIEDIFLDDTSLTEGWYSIGLDRLAVVGSNPQIGQCGTYFPIYLKDNITSTQQTDMEINEVVVTAKVVGIDVFGMSEEIEIKLRKCGNDMQVYLKQPSSKSSAYCLENGAQSRSVMTSMSENTYSSFWYCFVNADLQFYEETRSGVDMYIPYIVFQCQIQHHSSQYTIGSNANDDGLFYYVTWYIDETVLKSVGPVPRSQLNVTRISELDLLEAGYSMGIKVRCSFEFTESLFGKTSGLIFSYPFETVFKKTTYIEYIGDNAILHTEQTIPLGCASPIDDIDTLNCTLTFDIVDSNDDSVCGIDDSEKTRHEKCGVSVLGYTKRGCEHVSNCNYASYQHVTLIQNLTTNTNVTIKVRLRHIGNDTEHAFWEGYEMPNIKFTTMFAQFSNNYVGVYKACQLCGTSVEVSSYDSSFYYNVRVKFESEGEYLLYRSKTSPVMIQAKVQQCSNNNGQYCVCALTYRNLNDIFAIDACAGVVRKGYIYGGIDGGNVNTNYWDMMSINGLSFSLYYSWGSVSMSYYGVHSDDHEGIFSMEEEGFSFRDGTHSQSHEGFVNSWKITANESLLNPANHVDFGFTEEFYLCSCPNADFEPDSLHYYTYTGLLKCNLDFKCQTDHNGIEWKPLALPDYAITYVDISVRFEYQDRIPVLQFECDFETNDDYEYKIQWTNQDASILYETGYLSATEARAFVLTDIMLLQNDIFPTLTYLDTQFVCGVSVFKPTSREQMIPMQYSQPFIPLEIVETNIQMIRGQDAVIEIKKNFPFACNKDIDCFLEFLVYDPNDSNDCTDSTVVVKSKSTCGQRIGGVKSTQEVVVTKETIRITVGTKNNNKYKLRDTFSLKVKVGVKGQGIQIFTGEFQSVVTLFVQDDAFWQRTYCYATNDPRLKTFDGIYYGMQLIGEFILYRHKRTGEEIQMMTMSCNGGWASCSCGVAVRAGRDVFVINHCNGVHITGFILHEDNILDVREVTQNNYQIILPHGTSIKVYISPWREYIVNIYIYPTPSDVGQIEGLCGNFNGDYQDDFVHKDGTTETTRRWWYYEPNDFSRSWGIVSQNVSQNVWASESLLNVDVEPTIDQRLTSYSEDEHMCVCPNGHTSSEAICSANEEATCSTTVHHRGTIINIQTRVERSVGSPHNGDFVHLLRKLRNKRKDVHRVKKRTVTENPNAITEEEALALCTEAMQQSCTDSTVGDDGTTEIIDVGNITQDCARDKMIDGTVEWEKLACVTVLAVVQHELEKDTEMKEANPKSTEKVEMLCIGNCNDHGDCVNGTCNCNTGYAGDDCTISTSEPPKTSDIQGDGTCDKQMYGTCDCISVTSGDGYVPTAKCNICVNKTVEPGKFTRDSCTDVSADYQSYNNIHCCIPSSQRRKRETSGSFTEIYTISTSNDGINFGDATPVLVLDTTCQNITTDSDGNYVASLLDGNCFIGGSCYADGSSSSSDSCDVCDITTDTFGWTNNDLKTDCIITVTQASSITSAPGTHTDDGLPVYVFVIIGIVALLAVVGLVVVLFYLAHKSKRSVAPNDFGDSRQEQIEPNNAKWNLYQPEAQDD